ncbi:unnamed protein product [Blepharisma stoltei]|uniref:Uncharacterized protein n=1 Tax=Blepharisma stoltei TaxID=1481888 RepID=A0AAU9IPX7_9CILI|nr:unnamed protein product [Blepharisma stoltei]
MLSVIRYHLFPMQPYIKLMIWAYINKNKANILIYLRSTFIFVQICLALLTFYDFSKTVSIQIIMQNYFLS